MFWQEPGSVIVLSTLCPLLPVTRVSLSLSRPPRLALPIALQNCWIGSASSIVSGRGNCGGRNHYDDFARKVYKGKREGDQHGERMLGADLGCGI